MMRMFAMFAICAVACLSWACSDDETSGSGGSGPTSTTASTGGSGAGGNSEGGGAEGGGGQGGAGGGTCVPFSSECAMSDICCDAAGQTGECYAFGMGARCTIPCPPDPAECPNDGAGCNDMPQPRCKAN